MTTETKTPTESVPLEQNASATPPPAVVGEVTMAFADAEDVQLSDQDGFADANANAGQEPSNDA